MQTPHQLCVGASMPLVYGIPSGNSPGASLTPHFLLDAVDREYSSQLLNSRPILHRKRLPTLRD